MATTSMDPWAWFRKQLETADADRLREMITTVTGMLMNAEVSRSAAPATVSARRSG